MSKFGMSRWGNRYFTVALVKLRAEGVSRRSQRAWGLLGWVVVGLKDQLKQ